MTGQTPAPWYVEINGQKQGPFTSQQIMKLLMDGALKVESKIFDSTANAWKIAADVIPYLELSAARPGSGKTASRAWTPPPKPTELKDVHVAPLNDVHTGSIDYFALINDQRRATERARAAANRQTGREVEDEKQRRAQAARLPDRVQLTAQRRAEPPKIVRVAPPIETPAAAAIKASPADEITSESTVPKPGTDGILSAEVDPGIGLGIGKVILFGRRLRNFSREHKSQLSMAAGLAFVFVLTYGTARVLSDRKERAPANVVDSGPASPAAQATAKLEQAMPSSDALGTGRNRIHRTSGGVSARNSSYPRVVPPLPEKTANNGNEPPRDPPQYYNSGDDNAGTPVAAAVPPAATAEPAPVNTDPSQGVVSPPGFMPSGDQNAQPSEAPQTQ